VHRHYEADFSLRPIERRMALLRAQAIDVVLDIGANDGQFAAELRSYGYQGRIVSFEPLPAVFPLLRARANQDSQWQALPYALCDAEGTLEINIASHSASSSFLDMVPALKEALPSARYVGKHKVQVKTLNLLFDSVVKAGDRVYVKIDAQGFEKKILDGASKVFDRIAGFQLEVSLVALYSGESLIEEMIGYMRARRFVVMGIEPGFSDSTGRLLQTDLVFFRPAA
jgi:FkbM family methyltransferase